MRASSGAASGLIVLPLASDRTDHDADVRTQSVSIVEPRVGSGDGASACGGGSRFIKRALKRDWVVPLDGADANKGDRDGTEPARDERVVCAIVIVNIEGSEYDASA
jgi:hypothetical protein